MARRAASTNECKHRIPARRHSARSSAASLADGPWTPGAPAAGESHFTQPPVVSNTRLYNELGRKPVEFCIFDAAYVNRLTAGDPATEAHFTGYFAKFLTLKLRARRLSPQMAEDIRQETLFRVLRTLRSGRGVAQPERFGAFVNGVCNNVVLEFLQRESKHPQAPENAPELADERVDIDGSLISEQSKKVVAEVLESLTSKDREILRLIFFEEADRQEICAKLGVEADYLRVLLHRAKSRFERAYLRKQGAMQSSASLFSVTIW
jgi:RNA polymerase sigma-70 factor, ECF subfamily